MVVIVVPHGTVTVLSDEMAQADAVTDVPPLSVTPVPPEASAMMQPGVPPFISA